MRKNWTKNEDTVLSKIVGEVGLNDWTSVANKLKQRYDQFHRTGKQCRERWYNHLDPKVNKDVWSYEQELLLFELHKEMGNRWKQISLKLKGRTDNNIKNHFYSTLRRSLRRLNKVIGEKNSTLHMRQIKPSVLTIILNFIYDHQEENTHNGKEFIKELKDLPKLIFEFAQFKPVKGNMDQLQKQEKRQQIEIIFNLVQQFKESYYEEKKEKRVLESEESEVKPNGSPLAHQIITSEFKPQEKAVNIIVNQGKEEASLSINSLKWESGEKDKSSVNQKLLSEGDLHFHMLQLQQPSPLTYIHDNNNQYSDLVVIGRHWSPKQKESDPQEMNIDQILQMNYE